MRYLLQISIWKCPSARNYSASMLSLFFPVMLGNAMMIESKYKSRLPSPQIIFNDHINHINIYISIHHEESLCSSSYIFQRSASENHETIVSIEVISFGDIFEEYLPWNFVRSNTSSAFSKRGQPPAPRGG
jgi:hypothetical protein